MIIKIILNRLHCCNIKSKDGGVKTFANELYFIYVSAFFLVQFVYLVNVYAFGSKSLTLREKKKVTTFQNNTKFSCYICDQQALHKVKLNSRNGPASLPQPAERGGLCKDLIESLSAPTIHSPGAALSSYCRGTMT